jgi:putative flavoprotein involved in K+ transport
VLRPGLTGHSQVGYTGGRQLAKRRDTVVIGAGQNGLAVGYQLKRRAVDFVIIDGCERVGDSWRRRWDSLVLFTWAEYNGLPGWGFPADRNTLPTKDQVADYCEAYANKFALPIELGVGVERVTRAGEGFVIETDGETYEADNVVVATGSFRAPRIPDFAGELDDSIVQLHTSEYQKPGDLGDGGDVLVVGAGSSGSQIAIELAAARSGAVYLSGPDVGELPPLKAKILKALGLLKFAYTRPRSHFLGNKLYQKATGGGYPLILFTYKDVVGAGVERLPRTVGVKNGKPLIEGGGEPLDVSAVVWATGYRPSFSWIDLPVFDRAGFPRHVRGVVDEAPGLFFMGLIFQYSLSSQLLMGAARDSEFVADALVARSSKQPITESQPVAVKSSTGSLN